MDALAPLLPFTKRFWALNKNDLTLLARAFDLSEDGGMKVLRQRVKTYFDAHEDVLQADPRFATLYLVGRAVPAPVPQQQQQQPNAMPQNPQQPPQQQPNVEPQEPQQPLQDQPIPGQHGPHPLNENPPVQPPQIPDHIEGDAPLNLQPGALQPPPDMPLIPSVDNLSQTVATMFPDADAATRRDYLDGLRTINQRFVSAQVPLRRFLHRCRQLRVICAPC
ncbi:hypothetical protein BD410DRAFT_283762 [Rickenella mellea]|uniref:Uncharacterized protein n=1 Tax=Rickenella mellea TaxID=50990 RepID=A0A4Y7Q377_9AGAM|nr:hypothetical protein BD410DRAFT_283762 [Rickenella mellea]